MALTAVREHYLLAAAAATRLLGSPAVGQQWDQPSALADFGVSGLAGHLAQQIRNVRIVLDLPEPSDPPLTVDEFYARAKWLTEPPESEVHAGVRERGEQVAAGGPVALHQEVQALLTQLHDELPRLLPTRTVTVPWARCAMTLDDFLLTRLMEVSVHSDDLAVSVGVPTPNLDATVLAPVLQLLTSLSVRRHGSLAVLRALSRRERAPQTIAAF
jgi:hypothetical protein